MVTITSARKKKNSFDIKSWILETRPQYLLLPVMLVLAGTATAWYEGVFNMVYALLALVGMLLCHASVNILNDYVDFKSGVDLKTIKTPFSGGSGLLPAGKLTPRQAFWYGVVCLILAAPIGIFFIIVQGWQLLPLLLVAAGCVVFYTPVILKTHFPEWSPGLGLGVLPVLGSYFAQTGGYTLSAVAVAVPAGFLVLDLLLLNEFPDAEADRVANRKTLPITLGKRRAAVIYSVFMILTYLWVVAMIIGGLLPKTALLVLLTLPFAYQAMRGSFNYNDLKKIMPAQANNVIAVLGVPFFLGIGYILAAIFPVLR